MSFSCPLGVFWVFWSFGGYFGVGFGDADYEEDGYDSKEEKYPIWNTCIFTLKPALVICNLLSRQKVISLLEILHELLGCPQLGEVIKVVIY